MSANAGSTVIDSQIKGEALRNLFFENTAISEYRAFVGIKKEVFSEHHNADGTTRYKEYGVVEVTGQWSLVGDDKICYKYPGVNELNGTHCFFVYYRGEGCYYNYSRRAMTLSGPRNWDDWTSRFVIKGEGGICGAPIG